MNRSTDSFMRCKMATNIDIKAVEQRAWNSFFSDGRLEFTFGLAFLLMGLLVFLPDGPLYWITIPILLIVPGAIGIAIKKLITEPRIGRVTFSFKRRLNMAGAVAFLAAAVLFGMAAWLVIPSLSSTSGEWLGANWFLVLLIGQVVLVFALIAWFLKYWGVFFIGLGLAFCFLVNEVWNSEIMFFIVGAIVAIVGAVKLIIFIRRHPVVAAEGE